MNPLNPRNVKDFERFEKGLRTEFARQNFWKLQKSLGHKFWSLIQEAVEGNLNNEKKVVRNVFASVARVRKLKAQNEWSSQLERKADLKSFALRDLALTSQISGKVERKMTEADILPVNHNVTYVDFCKKVLH